MVKHGGGAEILRGLIMVNQPWSTMVGNGLPFWQWSTMVNHGPEKDFIMVFDS